MHLSNVNYPQFMAIYQIKLIYGTNIIEAGISSRVACMII